MSKPTAPPVGRVSIDDNDRLNPKVSASALDFLLIELVPQVQRTARQLRAKELELRQRDAESMILMTRDLSPATSHIKRNGTTENSGSQGDKNGPSGIVSTSQGLDPTTEDEETHQAVIARLDALGYRVGQGLVEGFSANKPRPQTPLDAIKFVCKDLWQLVFRKQIDNLKTNHRGIFVLTDQRFQPLSRISVDRLAGPKAAEDTVKRAQLYLCFPAGIVRGALVGLGIEATVVAESSDIPTATFQIKTKGAKA